MSEPRYRRVVVVGVGLIGGSVALALRERGLAGEVVGVVRSADRASRAIDAGVVEAATDGLADACRGADVVVVTTPVGTIAEKALAAAEAAGPGALVTDAGSTKATLVAAVDASNQDDAAPFVGAHPLAGDHRSGPEAARANLFAGATTVVTPTEATPAQATARCRAFWESLGSTVVAMSPDRHDTLLAATSHVPHVAAAAVAAATPDDALPLVATGWADTTRVAAGAAALWRDILLANRKPIAEQLRSLGDGLRAYAAALDAGDGDRLEALLEAGRLKREHSGKRSDALGS